MDPGLPSSVPNEVGILPVCTLQSSSAPRSIQLPKRIPKMTALSLFLLTLLLIGGGETAPDDVVLLVNGCNATGCSAASSPASSLQQAADKRLSVGLLVPHTTFKVREYSRAVNFAMTSLRKSDLTFLNAYKFQPSDIYTDMLKVNPSPTAILDLVCETFLKRNVSAVLFLSNTELYGRNTAAAQYFLQLTNYLRIPVIAWNADNSGLEKRSPGANLVIQLAPSASHQASAMLSLLKRYSWRQFAIVTSAVAGYQEFIQAVGDAASDRFKILSTLLVSQASHLEPMVGSEARIVLLYSTREEARSILKAAGQLGLTGEKYVWIATQSVIGSVAEAPPEFPVGMLGVHFETSDNMLTRSISTALKVFVQGVEAFHRAGSGTLDPRVSCEGTDLTSSRWSQGEQLFKHLQGVRLPRESDPGRPALEFNADGTQRSVELKIVNLQPGDSGAGSSKELRWTQIGDWYSWKEPDGLDIRDIVWPGHSHVPPEDGPDKFHLKVAFLEEPPFISVVPPDPVTGRCPVSHGVPCHVGNNAPLNGDVEAGQLPILRNNVTQHCCSGFCIDLLEKFRVDLGFTYELNRVDDPKFGTLNPLNGRWSGLMGALANRRVDMVMTSLTVNAERENVADFTIPFMETGIAILVAKRTGIISPTAFLEPFDTASWFLVGVVAIQVAALAIFLFEWLSPSGYNMQTSLPANQSRFSLFRTYWLVWAILFQASVNIDCPKGFTSRFISNVWAAFAVVFLAIYTANLAAFMITREEFYDLSGVEDPRLTDPMSHQPPFRFGTVVNTHTEATLLKHYRDMYYHMRNYNRNEIGAGIEAVKRGELDAFLYDGAVLDYLVSQDEECRLLTVGSWYAMTGYGVAFPRGSKYLAPFNEKLLEYIENGDIDRLRRFWLTGVCKPDKQDRQFSEPLATEQFLSAFLLLLCGIALAFLLLGLEHVYFRYIRSHLAKHGTVGACCSLISINMGRSLTFRDAVFETQDRLKTHQCQDEICRLHVRRLRLQLDCAWTRIHHLEKLVSDRDLEGRSKIQLTLHENRPPYHGCNPPVRLEGTPELETVL